LCGQARISRFRECDCEKRCCVVADADAIVALVRGLGVVIWDTKRSQRRTRHRIVAQWRFQHAKS